jgi:hypothetical protein
MVDKKQANFAVYALAIHFKELEELREDPNNHYVVGARYEGGLRREKVIGRLYGFGQDLCGSQEMSMSWLPMEPDGILVYV